MLKSQTLISQPIKSSEAGSMQLFRKTDVIKIPAVVLCLVIFSMLSLTGCSNNQHKKAVEESVANIKARPMQTLPPLPPVKQYLVPKYDVANLRSPFQPNAAQELDAKRIKEPLEHFSLDSLHLVGIITRDNQNWGLIEAPDGKLYQVTVGQHLGQNAGKIIGVHQKHLDIVELIEEGNRSTEHHTILTLWSRSQQAAAKAN